MKRTLEGGRYFRIVHDPQDRFDRAGTPPPRRPVSRPPKRFLSIWYRCCHTYGRLYRNRTGTAFEGRCPRCGNRVRARIGPGGSTRCTFEAR